MVCCYTFGQPRIGNAKFCKLYARYCGSLFRVVNANDPIAHMPRKSPGFKHVKNTRVQYAYPPVLSREGYEHHLTIEEGKARRSLDAIKGMAKGLKRNADIDLRVHTNYVGISLPMKAAYNEPYSFVIHRYIDNTSPQPVPARGDPPRRAELDLSMEEIPFDLFLRDAEAWDKTALHRRLLVYTGIRQRPYSRYATPIVSEGEAGYVNGGTFQPAGPTTVTEPVYPGTNTYTTTTTTTTTNTAPAAPAAAILPPPTSAPSQDIPDVPGVPTHAYAGQTVGMGAPQQTKGAGLGPAPAGQGVRPAASTGIGNLGE